MKQYKPVLKRMVQYKSLSPLTSIIACFACKTDMQSLSCIRFYSVKKKKLKKG